MDPIEIIKRVIFEKGLKKQAVAERMGITPQQFSDMLNKRRTIKYTDIVPICDALGITPNDLYGVTKSA